MSSPRAGAERIRAIGVVLPVHNEEDLLGRALEAVGDAFSQLPWGGIDAMTAIVLDGCSDGSAHIARDWIRGLRRGGPPHRAIAVPCRSAGVGNARRLGATALLRRWRNIEPRHIWLATTDADSRVPTDWLTAQLAAYEDGADIWSGRVAVEDWSHHHESTALCWKATYAGELAPIHGASLGFNAQTYLQAGGFAALQTGEDRALYRAMVEMGGHSKEDSEVRVITSARRRARAPMGFSHALSTMEGDLRGEELSV